MAHVAGRQMRMIDLDLVLSSKVETSYPAECSEENCSSQKIIMLSQIISRFDLRIRLHCSRTAFAIPQQVMQT